MLLSEPLASLITFFKFNKMLAQQSTKSDSFYYVTESSELNLKNKVPKHTHFTK